LVKRYDKVQSQFVHYLLLILAHSDTHTHTYSVVHKYIDRHTGTRNKYPCYMNRDLTCTMYILYQERPRE
jgi:hypothetical protein